MACLAEAWLGHGDGARAHEVASQALEVAGAPSFPSAVAWAQRILGRIAQQRGYLQEADARLHEALATFAGSDTPFEVGRTHLALAALRHALGDREAVVGHLREARTLFESFGVPVYIERADTLAREYGC